MTRDSILGQTDPQPDSEWLLWCLCCIPQVFLTISSCTGCLATMWELYQAALGALLLSSPTETAHLNQTTCSCASNDSFSSHCLLHGRAGRNWEESEYLNSRKFSFSKYFSAYIFLLGRSLPEKCFFASSVDFTHSVNYFPVWLVLPLLWFPKLHWDKALAGAKPATERPFSKVLYTASWWWVSSYPRHSPSWS